MAGGLAVGSSGVAASATVSTGCASAGVADCCDSPHPTRSTAAIVVSRRCFIGLRRSSGGVGWFSCLQLQVSLWRAAGIGSQVWILG
jgi:hypothetical protein